MVPDTRDGALTITRAAATGFVASTALGSLATSESRNGFDELATTSASLGATPIFTEAIVTRDALGRIATKTEAVQGTATSYAYTYDARGRLTHVFENAALVREYTQKMVPHAESVSQNRTRRLCLSGWPRNQE